LVGYIVVVVNDEDGEHGDEDDMERTNARAQPPAAALSLGVDGDLKLSSAVLQVIAAGRRPRPFSAVTFERCSLCHVHGKWQLGSGCSPGHASLSDPGPPPNFQ